ncbi:TRAP transporter small permease [Comamonas flocculans]|uniref:TRAP transporter small permease protein n=1 Tax=Comamonas flocculans TaxID=2597701 RepID=A0A5B8S021_9BURK|nr:TRAP transporter small permease [Comamonas flocculans]QEA13915.1 TRAP transporter small permease [Comamonas flocculans]
MPLHTEHAPNPWARRITHTFEVLIVACLAIMGILVFGNVVLRYAFNSGIAVSEELSRLLFVWLIFLGAVLASAQRIHIGFDTLQRRVGPRLRRALITFSGLLILAGCVVFIVGGWKQTVINLGNTYPVLGISYAWLYGVGIVFGVALIVPVSYNIVRALRGDFDKMTHDLGDRIEQASERIEAEVGGQTGPRA